MSTTVKHPDPNIDATYEIPDDAPEGGRLEDWLALGWKKATKADLEKKNEQDDNLPA